MNVKKADLLNWYKIKSQLHKGPLGTTFNLIDTKNKNIKVQAKFINDFARF